MKNNMTSFERRLSMLYFITKSGYCKMSELADKYLVSDRTIRRDIVFLSRYVPIFTKSGVNGAVFLLGDYRNEMFRYLSYDEEALLRRIMETLSSTEKNIVNNIINKFSQPNPAT